MKLCIVGGAGYIGSRLIPSLLEHNYEITVFDLFWFGDYLPDEIEKVKKDVLDITIEDVVNSRDGIGGTSFSSVSKAIKEARSLLNKKKSF